MIFFKTILPLTILSLWISNASVFAVPPPANTGSNAVPAKAVAEEENANNEAEESSNQDQVGEDAGFKRYKSIIDRAPFGIPPPNFNPQAVPGSAAAAAAAAANGEGGGEMTPAQLSAEEQRLISEVQVSVLNITPAGSTMVGFTDKANHKNYYLKVGSEKDGWKVVSADAAAQSVVLSKDGIEATVSVGSASSANKDKKGAALRTTGALSSPAVAAANAAPLPEKYDSLKEKFAARRGGKGGAMSRLRERRLAETMRKKEAENARREEVAKSKKEIQDLRARLDKMRSEQEQAAIDNAEKTATLERLLNIKDTIKQNTNNDGNGGDVQDAPQGESE